METLLEEDYDTRNVGENDIDTWDNLKHHLRQYSKQMDELDEIPEE